MGYILLILGTRLFAGAHWGENGWRRDAARPHGVTRARGTLRWRFWRGSC